MKPTERVEQLAFDCYHEIAALPLLHTDAVCNIIQTKFNTMATELERVTVECEQAKSDRNKAGVIERRKYLPIISDLNRQVEELKAEIEKILGSPTLRVAAEMAAARNQEISQLRAQLAEATKDKQRLDWLEKNGLVDVGYTLWDEDSDDTLRQAIDAAIEAQEGKQ